MANHLMLNKMAELLTHHYNLAGAMSREAAAKGMGLDPEPYKHPYPGSTNYTVNVVTPGEAKAEAKAEAIPLPPVQSNGPNWLMWLLGGISLASLVALAVVIFWPKSTPTPSGPTNVQVNPQGLEAQVEVEWGWGKGPNGAYGARYRLGPDKEWIYIPNPPNK